MLVADSVYMTANVEPVRMPPILFLLQTTISAIQNVLVPTIWKMRLVYFQALL